MNAGLRHMGLPVWLCLTVLLTVTRFLHPGTGVQIYPPGAYIYPLPRFLNLATGFPYLATSTDDAVQ